MGHLSSLIRALLAVALITCCLSKPLEAASSETVAFKSGDKMLHGLVYRPPGPGPFPTILYNHGSAPGLANNQAFDALGPVFMSNGWAFFAPYRRGQGLSSDAGPYIRDQIEAARVRGGPTLAARTMVRLLSSDQFQDQMAALAWLRKQSFVSPGRIAVMGNSFGGVETVLGSDSGDYCAAVDVAGGAESWQEAPELRALMLQAVQHAKTPILFIQADNDFTVEPSRSLYAAMKKVGRPADLRIYPAFGHSPEDGHSFAYRGVDIWNKDVLRFLRANCEHPPVGGQAPPQG